MYVHLKGEWNGQKGDLRGIMIDQYVTGHCESSGF